MISRFQLNLHSIPNSWYANCMFQFHWLLEFPWTALECFVEHTLAISNDSRTGMNSPSVHSLCALWLFYLFLEVSHSECVFLSLVIGRNPQSPYPEFLYNISAPLVNQSLSRLINYIYLFEGKWSVVIFVLCNGIKSLQGMLESINFDTYTNLDYTEVIGHIEMMMDSEQLFWM